MFDSLVVAEVEVAAEVEVVVAEAAVVVGDSEWVEVEAEVEEVLRSRSSILSQLSYCRKLLSHFPSTCLIPMKRVNYYFVHHSKAKDIIIKLSLHYAVRSN